MAKLRIPKIGLLDWLGKGDEEETNFAQAPTQPIVMPSQNETQPIVLPGQITNEIKDRDSRPLMSDGLDLDLDGETLLVHRWNCIPELTAEAEESAEAVPSLATKNIAKTSKSTNAKSKENRSVKSISQTDTRPPEQSHPFANFSAESLQVIASNLRTPTSTLCWLATHFNPDVRATVAKNDSALPETIWLLAKDGDEAVRLAVAENKRTYENVLKSLCNDDSALVCWHAKQTLEHLVKQRAEHSEEAHGSSRLVRQTVDIIAVMQEQLPMRFGDSIEEIEFLKLIAGKTTTPAYRLATLAKHPSHEIRGLVAENTNAPREVFWLLAKDNVVEVKAKLTDNYNCPVEVLEQLQDDPDSYVAWQSKNIITKLLGKEVPAIFEDDAPVSSQRLLHTQ